MSFRVVASVLDHSDERLARRLILIVLAEAAHEDGVCYLGQEEIARKGRLSRTHVAEELKGLSDDGALQIRKAQRGRKRISVYRLNLPGLQQVDYEKLPFAISEPFDDVGTSDTVSGDDVGSTGSTTSDLPGFPESSPLVVEPSLEPEPQERTVSEVPVLVKIDGRNLGFDALAEVCRVPLENRQRVSQMTKALKEIRAYFAAEHPSVAGGAFEHALAEEIRQRARMYRARMPGAALTPTALAKWWHDSAPSARGRTDDDVLGS